MTTSAFLWSVQITVHSRMNVENSPGLWYDFLRVDPIEPLLIRCCWVLHFLEVIRAHLRPCRRQPDGVRHIGRVFQQMDSVGE
jgi:hypothetical protein